MSALKYQLKDLVSSLGGEANKTKDPEIKKHFYLIKAVVESKKDVKKTCEARGVSTDQFYMWAGRLLESGSLLSLKSLSKSAKKFWNKTPKRVEKRVIKLRKLEPFKGPERISFDLKKKFNMICPVSTVAAILKRAGLVTKAYRDRLTKKHMGRYRRPWPGYMQMDFKYTPYLLEGLQTYQLSAIDHHSSWRFIRSYQDRSLKTVMKFLNELEQTAPFAILQIQTDNATEFTDKYSSYRQGAGPSFTHEVDVWCQRHEIEHKLIPIGEKELNGKVENTHKWDDREFFSQINVSTYIALERETRIYNLRWNDERPTKALGWLTPNEVIEQTGIRAMVYLRTMLPVSAWADPKALMIISTETGRIIAPKDQIREIRESLAPKRPKQKSTVDRYLQYLAWEEKKKLRSWLAAPMILQIFSRRGSSL